MTICDTQAIDMATTTNNWKTPGATLSGRYRVATRTGRMTQEPLYPEGHPKRIEQDSQRNNIDVPSSSKKKKKR